LVYRTKQNSYRIPHVKMTLLVSKYLWSLYSCLPSTGNVCSLECLQLLFFWNVTSFSLCL
jgi:hypothetical protein